MKAFTERSPRIIGVITVLAIVVATAASLTLDREMFEQPYTITARFVDAGGLEGDESVNLAGVDVGAVGGIEQVGDRVEVDLKIDRGVELPTDTRADVLIETLLGVTRVRLIAGNDWDDLLEDGDTITDTSTPFDEYDLQRVGTALVQESDGDALNNLLNDLGEVINGKGDDVGRVLEGIDRLAVVVNGRQTEVRRLIDSTNTLVGTLSDRDEDILSATDDLNVVLSSLADRRAELDQLLGTTAETAGLLRDLIGENRPELDMVLDELHADLQIIDRHQVDLAQTVSVLSQAATGFASAFRYGPERLPNPGWINVFAQVTGLPDTLIGSCGTVDLVLDRLLPPDPRPCGERTGPEPRGSTGASAGEEVPVAGDLGGEDRSSSEPYTDMTALYRYALP